MIAVIERRGNYHAWQEGVVDTLNTAFAGWVIAIKREGQEMEYRVVQRVETFYDPDSVYDVKLTAPRAEYDGQKLAQGGALLSSLAVERIEILEAGQEVILGGRDKAVRLRRLTKFPRLPAPWYSVRTTCLDTLVSPNFGDTERGLAARLLSVLYHFCVDRIESAALRSRLKEEA